MAESTNIVSQNTSQAHRSASFVWRKKIARLLVVGLVLTSTTRCGYNEIQVKDEGVKAAWAEVLNQYQRRYDLIPNLVKTVQAFAKQEREVLTEITNARSRVGSIQATPELIEDPAAFAKFQQAQSSMGSALSRLMVVVENYPELKSNENFRDLQAQLEGTENRITVARNRYIKSVADFNTTVRVFPNHLPAKMFGYVTKATFEPENEEAISKPPEVNFE